MSLILDALNRSRQDAEVVPGLDAHHPVVESARPPLPLIVLALALALALALIAWLIWGRATTEQPSVRAPGPVASAPAVNPVVPRTAPDTASPGPAVVAEAPAEMASTRTGTARPVASTAVAETGKAGLSAGPGAAPAEALPAVPDPAVAALYSQPDSAGNPPPAASGTAAPAVATRPAAVEERPAVKAAPAVDEEPVDVDAMLRKAENELENSRLDENAAPFLNALSQNAKDAIPTLLYSAHAYSGKPGQSSVVINGKQLKVGGSPAAGVKIEEILPDSVVLSFRGDRFRLRALNSWVNL